MSNKNGEKRKTLGQCGYRKNDEFYLQNPERLLDSYWILVRQMYAHIQYIMIMMMIVISFFSIIM